MKQLPDTHTYYFIGFQKWPGHDDIGLYNLKIDVNGHPKDSTVSDITLKELGLVK